LLQLLTPSLSSPRVYCLVSNSSVMFPGDCLTERLAFLQSQDALLHLVVPSIHSSRHSRGSKPASAIIIRPTRPAPFSLSLDLLKGSSAPVSSLSCLASRLSFSALSSAGGWGWGTCQRVVRRHLLAVIPTFPFIFLLIAIHRCPGTRRFQRTCHLPDHRPSWN
jgi:hypothetical protein